MCERVWLLPALCRRRRQLLGCPQEANRSCPQKPYRAGIATSSADCGDNAKSPPVGVLCCAAPEDGRLLEKFVSCDGCRPTRFSQNPTISTSFSFSPPPPPHFFTPPTSFLLGCVIIAWTSPPISILLEVVALHECLKSRCVFLKGAPRGHRNGERPFIKSEELGQRVNSATSGEQ